MMPATNAPPAYVAMPQPVGQQQVATWQPAPVTVNPQLHSGNWKGIQWTGIIQVVLGSLTIILGVVGPILIGYALDYTTPICCGLLFYVVTGILGVVSRFKRHRGVAIAYMVMSILACLAAVIVIGFAARIVYLVSYNFSASSISGVYATLIILGIAEFVVAIVGASMTCGPLCNTGSASHIVIQSQAQPYAVVATQPQGPAYYNIPAGQPQVVLFHLADPVQQGQPPVAEAPPTGDQQHEQLIK